MQTPPPFHGYEGTPPPPKKKNNTVVILLAVLGGLIICCGAPIGILGYFGVKGFQGAMRVGGCFANVGLMQKALKQYTVEHDGKYPNAKNWQAEIGKYLEKGKNVKDSPIQIWTEGGEWACEDNGVKTGFMFNEALSEKKVADVVKADPEATVIFETKTVAFNQSGPFVKLPFNESPKIMGEFTNKRRGWFLLDADGKDVTIYNKEGKRVTFNLNDTNFGEDGKGLNFKVDTNSSEDSKDSKEDKSN